MTELESNLPKHVGIILDGNRRWAKAQGLPTLEGHLKGYNNLRELSEYIVSDLKIPYLTAYVFSTENWSRTEEEVGYLMKLLLRAFGEYLEDFKQNNGRIVVLGSRDKLSPAIVKAIDKAESETKNNTGGTLALCFNYGGQAEIVDAAQKLIDKPPKAKLTTEEFAQNLYHPEVPPLDLVIRTSGEQRLSGFMLYRAAYAEFYFAQKHWPEFTRADIDAALLEYANRKRRFGS